MIAQYFVRFPAHSFETIANNGKRMKGRAHSIVHEKVINGQDCGSGVNPHQMKCFDYEMQCVGQSIWDRWVRQWTLCRFEQSTAPRTAKELEA
jgi:hypothetical protein